MQPGFQLFSTIMNAKKLILAGAPGVAKLGKEFGKFEVVK